MIRFTKHFIINETFYNIIYTNLTDISTDNLNPITDCFFRLIPEDTKMEPSTVYELTIKKFEKGGNTFKRVKRHKLNNDKGILTSNDKCYGYINPLSNTGQCDYQKHLHTRFGDFSSDEIIKHLFASFYYKINKAKTKGTCGEAVGKGKKVALINTLLSSSNSEPFTDTVLDRYLKKKGEGKLINLTKYYYYYTNHGDINKRPLGDYDKSFNIGMSNKIDNNLITLELLLLFKYFDYIKKGGIRWFYSQTEVLLCWKNSKNKELCPTAGRTTIVNNIK